MKILSLFTNTYQGNLRKSERAPMYQEDGYLLCSLLCLWGGNRWAIERSSKYNTVWAPRWHSSLFYFNTIFATRRLITNSYNPFLEYLTPEFDILMIYDDGFTFSLYILWHKCDSSLSSRWEVSFKILFILISVLLVSVLA